MITKFIRKRNVNTALPFSKGFARVQVHANGDNTFKFTKRIVSTPPPVGSILTTELGQALTAETGDRLITD
jgi:hypothetical protein